jgi:hypothetical protein
MGWVILIALVITFQFVVYFIRRLHTNGQLTRVRFVIVLTFFFSIVFFVGATGLTTFTRETLIIWVFISTLQGIVGYLIAPFLGIKQ